MSTFLTLALLGCSESPEEKQESAPPTSAQTEDLSIPDNTAQKSQSSNEPLTLDNYLTRHQEHDAYRQDLAILFGEDLKLTKSDLDRFKGSSPEEISTRFLSEGSDFVRDLSQLLAPPIPQDQKFVALKAYLETGQFSADVSKSIIKASSLSYRLSSDNPINELIEIESVVHPELESQTRDYLNRVIYGVATAWTPEMSPQKCLETAYTIMTKTRINGQRIQTFAQEDPLFCTNLARNALDCDTSSFVILAVAHELGWPVSLVMAPHHAFVTWENKGYFDQGRYYADPLPSYWNKADIAPEAIAQGTYLQAVTTDELRGLYYNNRASYYSRRSRSQTEPGKKDADLRAFDTDIRRATSLFPRLEVAHHNFGLSALRRNDVKTACQEITRALELDPYDESALSLRKGLGSCAP
jgi:hypothetical protein